jgi:hypothetical protein
MQLFGQRSQRPKETAQSGKLFFTHYLVGRIPRLVPHALHQPGVAPFRASLALGAPLHSARLPAVGPSRQLARRKALEYIYKSPKGSAHINPLEAIIFQGGQGGIEAALPVVLRGEKAIRL